MFFIRAWAFGLVALVSNVCYSETITTDQIIARTLQAATSCIDWKWVGNCFWLDCNLLNCRVRTSIKVRHFRPDLLVTVQTSPKHIPWREMRALLEHPQTLTLRTVLSTVAGGNSVGSAGHPAVTRGVERSARLRFFEANVFGHPLEDLPVVVDQLFCEPRTTRAKPYFQSTLDAMAWRFSPLESLSPNALIPGRREIGDGATNSWSAVYPRTGFVLQPSPAKAAAVAAYRACDIVIGPKLAHVAYTLEPTPAYTSVPNHLHEREPNTGLWQMISPKVDNNCTLFGSSDPHWDAGRTDSSESFIWNLWRPYECCEKRGQHYLGGIDF